MRCLVLALIAGCGFSKSTATPADDMPIIDAEVIDDMVVPMDMPDEKCFGGGPFYICLPAVPSGMVVQGNNIDTSQCNNGSAEQKAMIGTTPVCVVAGDQITINSATSVGVFGNLPLVLVAVTSITIDGTLDASSVRGNTGPNANPTQCITDGIDGNPASGGGGAGGSFGSKGGDGGNGAGTAGTKGLAPAAIGPSTLLRGGCRGGTGGDAGGGPGTAGPGGGAVYLVSRGTITINGIIDASGGGGDGGQAAKGGGAGAGSGGMIAFHAMQLSVTAMAKVNANGGGGGAGAGQNDDGGAGQDPNQLTPLVAALGSQDSTTGRVPGGNGAGGVTGATGGTDNGNGGGGGGGGFGQIRVLKGGTPGSFPAGTVSPIPTL